MVRTASDVPAALLEQSRTVCEWLAGVIADDFARPTVLPGWDVRTLTEHLVLVHRGLARVLRQPTRERPLPNSEFVRRYRRDLEMIMESTRTATGDYSGPVLVDQLDEEIHELAELLRLYDPRSVVSAPQGPVTAGDFLTTRIVEVVVHADDLSRSLLSGRRSPASGRSVALYPYARRYLGRAATRAFGGSAGAAVRSGAVLDRVRGGRGRADRRTPVAHHRTSWKPIRSPSSAWPRAASHGTPRWRRERSAPPASAQPCRRSPPLFLSGRSPAASVGIGAPPG